MDEGQGRMKLTIVGCAGSYPGPDSAASCYLVEAEHQGRSWRIVLDLGNGALGALHNYTDQLAVDAVLLSHLHADHCIDMTSYYVLRKYHPKGAQPPIPVWGPRGTARRLASAYDLPKASGMREEFDFMRLKEPFEFGPFVIEPIALDHPVEAFGFRITADGATLAYTGDTGRCDELDYLARDVDLLLCEASYLSDVDNPVGVHLTGAEAAEIANRAGAKRLVLTHIPAWYDPQDVLADAAGFNGPVELARPSVSYDLG